MARQEKRDEALTRTAPNRRCDTEGLWPSVRFERQPDYRKSKGRPILELKHLEKMERELLEQQLKEEKR